MSIIKTGTRHEHSGANFPDTIITSFPQRWGSYFTNDPSGVHTRVRDQLRKGEREIGNPYDLVLSVFDVCCRTFYENTSFEDRQPLMNYIFTDSINFVVSKNSGGLLLQPLTL